MQADLTRESAALPCCLQLTAERPALVSQQHRQEAICESWLAVGLSPTLTPTCAHTSTQATRPQTTATHLPHLIEFEKLLVLRQPRLGLLGGVHRVGKGIEGSCISPLQYAAAMHHLRFVGARTDKAKEGQGKS